MGEVGADRADLEARRMPGRVSSTIHQNLYHASQQKFPGGCAPGGGPHPPAPVPLQAPPERLFGMKASDIDKYSRIVFPITFLSFHLMYCNVRCLRCAMKKETTTMYINY